MSGNIPEVAISKLGALHNQRFFSKLANHASDPIFTRTQAEQDQLLKLALECRGRYDQHMDKQAYSGNPFLSAALQALTGTGKAGPDFTVKQAAQEYVNNPELAQAALDYQEWLNSQASA
jgi:hypothetical protein